MGFQFFLSMNSRNYPPRNSLKETAPRTTACPSYSIDHKVIFEHTLNCDSIVAKAVTFETTSRISAQTQTTWVFEFVAPAWSVFACCLCVQLSSTLAQVVFQQHLSTGWNEKWRFVSQLIRSLSSQFFQSNYP